MSFDLLQFLQGAANNVGQAVGSAADAIIPGDQSSWHQAPQAPRQAPRPASTAPIRQAQPQRQQAQPYHLPSLMNQINQSTGFNNTPTLQAPRLQPIAPPQPQPQPAPQPQTMPWNRLNPLNNPVLNPMGQVYSTAGKVAQTAGNAVDKNVGKATTAINKLDHNFSLPVIGNVANAAGSLIQSPAQTLARGGQIAQGQNPYAGMPVPNALGTMGIDALNALTLGKGGILAKGAEKLAAPVIDSIGNQVLKKAAGNAIKTTLTSAPIMGGYGAAGTLQAGDTNPWDILKNAGIAAAGAPIMGLAHGAMPLVKPTIRATGAAAQDAAKVMGEHNLALGEAGKAPLDPLGASKGVPKDNALPSIPSTKAVPKPIVGTPLVKKTVAPLAKQPTQAEMAAALGLKVKDIPKTSLVDKTIPTKLKMAQEAAVRNTAETRATAAAISAQREAPIPLKLPTVQEGDVKQAILNSRAAPNLIKERSNIAVASASKLSPADHALLDNLRTTEPQVLAKQAQNPTAFLQAAKDAKAYNDYTHALGSGSGQSIGYRKNYGASEQWNTADKQTAAILDQYQAKLRSKPGYSKARLIPDYKTGEALGMKRLNPNFATDLAVDSSKRQRDISELALAKGLHQAYPGQVAVGEIPRGYTALQIAHGRALSMPTAIAEQINKRGTAPSVTAMPLKAFDATNRGLKYTSLGGGTFHSITTAGNAAGQQLVDATMHPSTIPGKLVDNLKLVGGTFSTKVNDAVTKAWTENGAVHADGLSTLDRAHISGVTLRPGDILGDANVKFMDKAKGTIKDNPANFITQAHDMVFKRQIPQAKQMIFEQATKGLDSNVPADLAKMRDVASAVNNFGGINRAIEGITPRDAQNLSRFVLATDFTETKFRKIGQALSSKGADGSIARQMIVGKALTFALPGIVAAAGAGLLKTPQDFATEMAKQLLDPSVLTNINDPKTGQNKVAKLPSTEVSELGRIFLPMFTDTRNRMSGAEQYITARTSAGFSTIWSLVTNKDYFGAPVIANSADGNIDVGKTVGNLALSKSPIPLSQGIKTAQGKQGMFEATLNTIGLRVAANKAGAVNSPSSPTSTAVLAASGSNLTGATKTPEAKAAAKVTKANNAAGLADGSRLGGTTALDQAQSRIDAVKKTFTPNLSQASQTIMTHYAKLNAQGKSIFDTNTQQSVALNQAKFENNTAKFAQAKAAGTISPVDAQKTQTSLAKEAITSKYSQAVLDFYGLSKANQNAMFASDRATATDLYNQSKQLDAQLTAAGGTSKYKTGLGTTKARSTKVAKGAAPKKFDYTSRLAVGKGVNSKALQSLLKTSKINVSTKTPKLAVYKGTMSKVSKKARIIA